MGRGVVAGWLRGALELSMVLYLRSLQPESALTLGPHLTSRGPAHWRALGVGGRGAGVPREGIRRELFTFGGANRNWNSFLLMTLGGSLVLSFHSSCLQRCIQSNDGGNGPGGSDSGG